MNEKMLSIHKYIEKNNTRKTLPYDEFVRSNSFFIDLYNNDYPYKIYFRGAGHDNAKRENYYFILESHNKYYLLSVKRDYDDVKRNPAYLFGLSEYNKMYELLYDLENNVPNKLYHFVTCKNIREEINISFEGNTFMNRENLMKGIFCEHFAITDRTLDDEIAFFDCVEYTLNSNIIKQHSEFSEFVENILSLDEKIEIKSQVKEEKIKNFKEKIYGLIK